MDGPSCSSLAKIHPRDQEGVWHWVSLHQGKASSPRSGWKEICFIDIIFFLLLLLLYLLFTFKKNLYQGSLPGKYLSRSASKPWGPFPSRDIKNWEHKPDITLAQLYQHWAFFFHLYSFADIGINLARTAFLPSHCADVLAMVFSWMALKAPVTTDTPSSVRNTRVKIMASR